MQLYKNNYDFQKFNSERKYEQKPRGNSNS